MNFPIAALSEDICDALKRVNKIDSPEVMDIQQVADYLQISKDVMYRYAADGTIPAFKLGNLWRFKKSSIDKWMEEKSEENLKCSGTDPVSSLS